MQALELSRNFYLVVIITAIVIISSQEDACLKNVLTPPIQKLTMLI